MQVIVVKNQNIFTVKKIFFKTFALCVTLCYVCSVKTELIHIRVEKELREKLEKMADADSRKLSDFIRVQLLKLAGMKKK